jgi:hypothetical protein
VRNLHPPALLSNPHPKGCHRTVFSFAYTRDTPDSVDAVAPFAPLCRAVPVSDLDIHRAAHLLIAHHDDNATAMARQMVDWMRQKGDVEGADTWLRIIVAIGTLGAPPTDLRH